MATWRELEAEQEQVERWIRGVKGIVVLLVVGALFWALGAYAQAGSFTIPEESIQWERVQLAPLADGGVAVQGYCAGTDTQGEAHRRVTEEIEVKNAARRTQVRNVADAIGALVCKRAFRSGDGGTP